MTMIIIVTRMKIGMRIKLMLLLSEDLERQDSLKFLRLMPRALGTRTQATLSSGA